MEGCQGADLPTQPSAWYKCKVNMTVASVPGDSSVYFRSIAPSTIYTVG